MSNIAVVVDSNTNDTSEELTLSNGIGVDLLRNDGIWSRFKFLKKLDLNESEL